MRTVLLVRFLSIASISICLCNGTYMGAPCKESERQALLMFKKDLEDPSQRLSSWVPDAAAADCCNWTGVACGNLTGHVHKLHLAGSYDDLIGKKINTLGGKVNPSLINLKHLRYLDLSFNSFEGIQIPSFLGYLKTLRYLNLSDAGFKGIVPHQLGNLSTLRYLDLHDNFGLMVENPQWLSSLSQLKYLYLGDVDLGKASKWLQVTETLPSLLVELYMYGCELYHIPYGIANMTNLKVLDLDGNYFQSTIPEWLYGLIHLESLILSANGWHGEISASIGNLTSLSNLDLDFSYLGGKIPNSLGNLCKLTYLDLSMNNFRGSVSEILESFSRCSSSQMETLWLANNNLSGRLSDQLGSFKSLRNLDLSSNSISGPIPASLGNLSYLEHLIIHNNSLEGVVSEVHFTNLTKLVEFFAHGNSLTLKTSPDWLPPFQLGILSLSSWHLEPSTLPMWLQSQTGLYALNMSNTGISGTIPTWFWNFFSAGLMFVDLSHNKLSGKVPNIVSAKWPKQKDSSFSDIIIDLGSNQFNGSLPLVSSAVIALDLSNSSFSGATLHFFCDKIDGPKRLQVLHLGNNLLTGEIPDCWFHWQNLTVVNIENNKLTGKIPTSIGYLLSLRSLHLRNNNLSGELPMSLQHSEKLLLLDLGGNELVGSIPKWIGKMLDLLVLSLRSNNFHGGIPDELCGLTNLQILDLAHNNLSGTVPRCFQNLTSMTTPCSNSSKDLSFVVFDFSFGSGYGGNGGGEYAERFIENAILVTKGREVKYDTVLGLVVSLDLSSNNIYGEIPEELTSLTCLQSLNLSENLLSGIIPSKIGHMERLESLDLSLNQLSGEISPGLSNLAFLNYLNLSYNKLRGEIPKGTQLQSFDPSSYIGNALCGPPLEENCSTHIGKIPPVLVLDQKRGWRWSDLFEDGRFYLSLGVGFAVGFWSVLGSLLLNMPWSAALSQFQNSIVMKLHGACCY